MRNRWIADDGPCPEQLGVHLGLVKVVGPFALLAAAYVISGLCCFFEIAKGEETNKYEERKDEDKIVVTISLKALRQLDDESRRELIKRLEQNAYKVDV